MLDPTQRKALNELLLTDSDLKMLLEKNGWEKLEAGVDEVNQCDVYELVKDVLHGLESLEKDIRALATRKNIRIFDASNIEELFSQEEMSFEEDVYNILMANIFLAHSQSTVHLALVKLRAVVREHLGYE